MKINKESKIDLILNDPYLKIKSISYNKSDNTVDIECIFINDDKVLNCFCVNIAI